MVDPLSDSSIPKDFSQKTNLDSSAIDAALACDWDKAEEINRKIVKDEPNNTACLNRLARALFELGKYQQAKKIYQSVLEIDPYNPIAQKNLKRAAAFKKNDPRPAGYQNNIHSTVISPSLFLEEPGITKVANLLKVAEPQKLSRLYAGAMANLVTKNRGLAITDADNNYLGVLADDMAHLLLKLIKGGNKYQVLIKSVKPNGLSILIREIFRSKKFKNQPSFLDGSKNLAYSSDNITLTYDDAVSDSSDSESEEATI